MIERLFKVYDGNFNCESSWVSGLRVAVDFLREFKEFQRRIVVFLAVVIAGSLSVRSSVGQSHPFRYDRKVIVTASYDGSINLASIRNGRSSWGSDIGLLKLSAIRQHLRCSASEIREIEQLLKTYSTLIIRQDLKSDPAHVSWDNIKQTRKNILKVLGDRRAKELGRIDRYLFFRREGPIEFLKAFCSKQVQLGESLQNELRAREVEIWRESLAKGDNSWKSTLAKIGKILPDEQKSDWNVFIKFWEQPLIADITVQQLKIGFLEEIKGKKPSAVLKGLSSRESELPLGQKAYHETTSFHTQIEMAIDGSWSIRRYSINPAETLSYQFSYLFHQNERTGKNDLDITSDQFARLDKKHTEYLREVDKFSGIGFGQKPTTFSTKKDKDLKAGKQKLDEDFQNQIWDEVLFPFQKEMLVQDAQTRLAKVRGPLTFFDRDSVKTLPNQLALENVARKELVKFRKQLEAIDQKAMRSLCELVSKYDLGFRLKDRPEYLPPSLFNFYFNKTRYSSQLPKSKLPKSAGPAEK